NKQQQLIHLINHLPIIFIKAPYHELQKSYHLFSMIQSLDKQLQIIETQPIFITKPIQPKLLNTHLITQHQFITPFPAINTKIKEANQPMEHPLNQPKQHY
ncbi:hypothetical protein, partial [Staphylococcus epidermidis]|uniref:hypothetical protein n=1 Tax=Staphylococcus epidermidis TaxID=1282 RepID=UPI001642FC17